VRIAGTPGDAPGKTPLSAARASGPPERFAAIDRLYGERESAWIRRLHVCVVGIGGVGSWAVEALARSGVGQITLIDDDTIEPGNVNRQIHALTETFEQPKIEVMAQRVRQINPAGACVAVRDFLTDRSMDEYLLRDYDYVIDAIDNVGFKAAMIAFCRRRRIPILTTGGAGGRRDPTAIRIADLARTEHDPLAAKVRKRLRERHGFSRNPKRRFDVECIHSTEQPRYPRGDGSVGFEKPGISGVSLDCRFGYGSACFVTGSFGFVAASRVLDKTLARMNRAERTA